MSKAEYDLLWKVKYKPEGAQGSINKSMVKTYLQKVYCTVLCMGMLRNMFGLVFSMNWFLPFVFFSLGDFTRRPSTAYRFCPFVFWTLTQGRADPRLQPGAGSMFSLSPGKWWAAWRGAAKFKWHLELCSSQMCSHQTRFHTTCIKPFCFQLSWTTRGTTLWAFGTCASHSGKGTRTWTGEWAKRKS